MSGPISNYGASTSSRRSDGANGSARMHPTRSASSRSDRKGKGRALAEDGLDREVDNGEDAVVKGLSFCIRFTDGTTSDLLDIYVNDGETIREIKRRIRILRPTLATNKLRLIYLGRILSDGVRLVPYISSLLQKQEAQARRDARGKLGDIFDEVSRAVNTSEEDGIASRRASYDENRRGHSRQGSGSGGTLELADTKDRKNSSNKGKGKATDSKQTAEYNEGRKIWLHCSVGEAGSLEAETDATAERQQTSQAPPATGFDRLREAGFSDEEIANIRAEFHVDGPSDTVVTGDEDEHARALEEQWMDNLGTGGADMASPNADVYTTLFKGVIAGFFFPFLPLFFFRQVEGEAAVFSKRMQMSIAAGVCINLLYGALRALS